MVYFKWILEWIKIWFRLSDTKESFIWRQFWQNCCGNIHLIYLVPYSQPNKRYQRYIKLLLSLSFYFLSDGTYYFEVFWMPVNAVSVSDFVYAKITDTIWIVMSPKKRANWIQQLFDGHWKYKTRTHELINSFLFVCLFCFVLFLLFKRDRHLRCRWKQCFSSIFSNVVVHQNKTWHFNKIDRICRRHVHYYIAGIIIKITVDFIFSILFWKTV